MKIKTCVKIKGIKRSDEDAYHNMTLNTKVTRSRTLQKIKDELLEARDNAIKCIIGNIEEQVDRNTLMAQVSAFDLESHKGLDDRLEKISSLFHVFGTDFEHMMEEQWNDLHISLKYKRKLNCNEATLLSQFKDSFSVYDLAL